MKRFTHEINDTLFIIEQDIDGWFWTNDDSECTRFFAAQSDALADAIRWVKEQEALEAERREGEEEMALYGSVEDQARADYRAAIRLQGEA